MYEKLLVAGALILVAPAFALTRVAPSSSGVPDLPAGSACRDYQPGQSMTQKDYDGYYYGLMGAVRGGHPDLIPSLVSRWDSALDREATPALYEVFHNPATKVTLGSFSDPQTRVAKETTDDGQPQPNSRDGGQGLRVVWQLEKNARFLSVITYWRLNYATVRPELIRGRDSLRVRVQIGDFARRPDDRTKPRPGIPIVDPGVGFAAVSYTAEGSSLEPTVPISPGREGGDPALHPGITGVTAPWACASCHRGDRNRLARHVEQTPLQAIHDFLEDARRNGVAPQPLEALRAQLVSPDKLRALFTSPALINVINRKCRGLKRSAIKSPNT